jgi:hypothetical protein
MLPLILTATLISANMTPSSQEMVDRFCAYVIGVEYGTDNLTDDEFRRFTVCREHLIPENSYKSNKNKGNLV